MEVRDCGRDTGWRHVRDVRRHQLLDLGGFLVGHQTAAHLGHRLRREDGLGAFARVAAEQAVHLAGRARPELLEHGIACLAAQCGRARFLAELLVVEGQRSHLLADLLGPRVHCVVKARDRDASAFVVHGRENAGERHGRIDNRAAVATGMQVLRGALHVDLEVRQPSQRRQDARQAGSEHGRVADDARVARELGGVRLDERREMLAADFLFAFREHDDVHGQRAARLEMRLERLHVEEELSLVVHGATRVEPSVADGRLEGRRRPQLERLCGLHVVVAVNQHRRRTGGRAAPFTDDHRVSRRWMHLRRESRVAQ